MTGQKFGIQLPQQANPIHVPAAHRAWKIDRLEPCVALQLRGAPALFEPILTDDHG